MRAAAQQFADIVLLFFSAWLVAFILEPLVGALVESRLPRLAAIGLTYLALLVLLSLGVVLLVHLALATVLAMSERREGRTLGGMNLSPIARALSERIARERSAASG